jgi:hypothetical protein
MLKSRFNSLKLVQDREFSTKCFDFSQSFEKSLIALIYLNSIANSSRRRLSRLSRKAPSPLNEFQTAAADFYDCLGSGV